jgi:hypothetical protein
MDEKKKKIKIEEFKKEHEIPDAAEEFPLFDAIDNEILMHRDAHFGGLFPQMIDYYLKEGKGAREEFPVERLHYLAEVERQMGENLAGVLLTGADAEKVASVKESYKKLRDLYDSNDQTQRYPILMADLILSESDAEEEAAVAAIVKEQHAIVRFLMELMRTEDLYDPLYPGYGLAPALAVRCLGQIGDKRSIISLFEAIGQSDFFTDELVLSALHAIGQPAKEFLLKVVAGHPINEDNERAAMALVPFNEDPEVSEKCLLLLQEKAVRQDIPLATYLIMVCEGLKDPELRQRFLQLMEDPTTPKMLHLDFKTIAKSWKSTA